MNDEDSRGPMNPGVPYELARRYSAVATGAAVLGATPYQLVRVLFDHALGALRQAQGHMERRETAAKGEQISRAITIVEELKASLNLEAGGDIARNLGALYDYMTMRLVKANAHNQPVGVTEVIRLLTHLRDAWAGIEDRVCAPTK